MESQTEIQKLQQTIAALESQRTALGDQVVDTALATLREKLVALQSTALKEQRKLATVLFADLVGFTSLSSQIDPEELRDLLKWYFAAWNSCITERGGVVEKFIGDAVMAVFGLPVSYEDDPERTILAALEMRQKLADFNRVQIAAGARPMAVRVGIHTGEVVVGTLGERQKDEFVAVGDTVNLASRLQSAAPENGILITQDTYRHIQGLFEIQPYENLHLKGIVEPVQTYSILGVKPRTFHKSQRGVEGVQTDMVGREAELARLQEIFREAVRSGQPHLLTLVGEAGIGKSRLLAEFEGWVNGLQEPVHIYKGRAFPATQTTPYSVPREIFALRFNIQASDPPSAVRQKLEAGWWQDLSPGVSGEEGGGVADPEHLRQAHFIGRLLGFELGPSSFLQEQTQDTRGFFDQALIDLRRYFRLMAGRQPVLLLLEDLHWADDSSLDLLSYIEENLASLPVLIVATMRRALFDRRPDWEPGRHSYTRLNLDPLSIENSLQLVRQILQNVKDIPQELSELITSSADGNPFYIEELVRMLLEDGVIAVDGENWRVEDRLLAGRRVPPTLVGVLQARLDSLLPEARDHLQRGSVIGRVFWDRAVEYLGEDREQGSASQANTRSFEVFSKLQSREMIFQRPRSTFDETNEFFFKHSLLRDVAYESLLKRQRRVYHRLAGSWLEQATERSQRADEFAAVIAFHYEQSGESGTAAGWYWQAARGAARRYANIEALHAFSRVLELTPLDEAGRRFDILLAREAVYDLLGQQEKRSKDLEELSRLAGQLNTPIHFARSLLRSAAYSFSISDFPAGMSAAKKAGEWAEAVGPSDEATDILVESFLLQGAILIRQGEFEAAGEHTQRAWKLAMPRQTHTIQAGTLRQLGLIEYYQGRPQKARQYFEQAYNLFVETGDRRGQAVAILNLGGATFNCGDYSGAQLYYTRSLELSREIGDRLGEARALNNLGITAVESGAYGQAEEYYLEALQIAREIQHRSHESSGLDNLGNLASLRYEYSRAQEYQQAALAIAREIGDRVAENFALLNLGHSSMLAGDYQKGYAFLKEAEALNEDLEDTSGDCEILLNLSDHGLYTGDLEAAELYARKALDLAREYELRSTEGVALHCLAGAFAAMGVLDQAVDHYRAAVQIYRETGAFRPANNVAAGLAGVLLSMGEGEAAQAQVEEILARTKEDGLFGMEDPIFVLLTCWRVLRENRDPRSSEVLEQGYALLQQIAAKFIDPAARQIYLENVAANRQLVAAWQEDKDLDIQ